MHWRGAPQCRSGTSAPDTARWADTCEAAVSPSQPRVARTSTHSSQERRPCLNLHLLGSGVGARGAGARGGHSASHTGITFTALRRGVSAPCVQSGRQILPPLTQAISASTRTPAGGRWLTSRGGRRGGGRGRAGRTDEKWSPRDATNIGKGKSPRSSSRFTRMSEGPCARARVRPGRMAQLQPKRCAPPRHRMPASPPSPASAPK